jgi:hypothetical protein
MSGGGRKVMTKFRTFKPEWEWDNKHSCNCCTPPAIQINDWLKENPTIEVINWQATPVGDHNELYITIQYKEN